MNLTKLHKQAIVSAVIADIPRARKDPDSDAQKIMDADIAEHAPKEIAVVWKNKQLASYLDIDSNFIGRFAEFPVYRHQHPVKVYPRQPRQYNVSKEGRKKLAALFHELNAEIEAIEVTKTAFEGAIFGLRTRKAFVTMFPELEKYAPEEHVVGTNLPAIANVMAGLVELGWPKSKDEKVVTL